MSAEATNNTSVSNSAVTQRETPLRGFSSQTSPQDAAREAGLILVEWGVPDALDVMRFGVLQMVLRSKSAAEQRGKGWRYGRSIVLNGGPWADEPTPSVLLRELGMAA